MTDSVQDFERVNSELDEIDAQIERNAKILLACVAVTAVSGPIGWYLCLKLGWTPGVILFPVLLVLLLGCLVASRVILRRNRAAQLERHEFLKRLRH